MDPQLDDPEFLETLYGQANLEPPAKPKLFWGFLHLDLAILDLVKPTGFIIQKGWN